MHIKSPSQSSKGPSFFCSSTISNPFAALFPFIEIHYHEKINPAGISYGLQPAWLFSCKDEKHRNQRSMIITPSLKVGNYWVYQILM